MKRNRIVLLMSALMLLTAAVYITGCSQPANNSSQNQGNQNNQSGNQGNQGGGINQGGNQGNQSNQTGIEGVWEVKKYGSTTYPDGGKRLYYYIKNGKLIMAEKKGTTLQKIEELSYTLSGNTMTVTMPNGEPPATVTYSISGSSLKMTTSEGLIECMKVTSPTAQEIESAQ